jgi:uncharacterized protein involved in response to NO
MRAAAGGIPRYRPWAGPAVLGAGFRPFFFLGALWAALAVPLWLAVFDGLLPLPTAFDPMTWHGHEMLFGFAQAAVAGFLLTAIPNWTGRMPIQGWALGVLAALFVAGRVAVTGSAWIGAAPAAAIDLAFPLVLMAALLREIVAGRNWRNLPMMLALGLLAAANGLTHLEPLGWAGTAALGLRLGIAVIVTLITLVGGRIIPSFTRNWLAKRGAARLPAPAGRFDAVAIAVTVAALAVWVAVPEAMAVAPLMALAAAMNLVRLARWQGLRTAAEPLVWVLHAGFLWLPLGFALIALAALTEAVAPSAALHALTGGAFATMILAVSTRATLGHTGRDLHADRRTVAIYLLVIVSALARIAAGFHDAAYLPLLVLAGTAWVAAFTLFLATYGPMLLGPRARSAG